VEEVGVFLYCNHIVTKSGGVYYANLRRILDFFAALAQQNPCCHLMIPCVAAKSVDLQRVAPINLPGKVIELAPYGGPVSALWSGVWNALRILRELKLAKSRYRKILFFSPAPNTCSFLVSMFAPRGIKFAFLVRGDKVEILRNYYAQTPLKGVAMTLMSLFDKWLSWLVAEHRALLFAFGQELANKYHVTSNPVHQIAPLLKREYVRATSERKTTPGPLEVVFAGRLSPEKNLVSLVRTCALARNSGHPFRLTIIGEGPAENSIRAATLSYNLSDWIILRGYLDNGVLMQELDKYDLACLPSMTEGVPGFVIEAFARRLPVVATRVGGLTSLFPEEIKFIEGFQPEDILKAILWCEVHRDKIASMADAAYQRLDDFLIDKNAEVVNSLLARYINFQD
jgi:glycosyltransferase involved in cell wall biosynthesis